MAGGNESGRPILDWDVALEQVGDDTEVLQEVVGVLLDTCPGMMQEVRQAVAAADPVALRRAAHTLKGAVAVFAAAPTVAAAQALEAMGREGTVVAAPAALATLEHEMDRLVPELEARLRAGS